MIDVQEVIKDLPHFETFCSVRKLHALVEHLRADSRFEVTVAGTSVDGVPIHHVRCGKGSVRALIVGFPHCMEPIGGLTVFSLLTLLLQGNRTLVEADVQWHIVPCIDPDGAILNEGWSQQPFTFETYMRGYYLQAAHDEVDGSFPITYKKLTWDRPSREAKVLQDILDEVCPDFFFSLHNAIFGGAFYFLSRDIDHKYQREIVAFLEQQRFPLQKKPLWKEICAQLGEGFVEIITLKNYYDHLERNTPSPEVHLRYGAASWDYLAQIKPSALTFVAELGYLRHPGEDSDRETGQSLRQFKLRTEADNKYLATVLLEEWEKVKGDLNPVSPFYRALVGGPALPEKDKLFDGGWPISRYPTRDLLFNPDYGRTMTESERFHACMVDGGFRLPLVSYQIVRLLKDSPQTPAVRQAIERLDRVFHEALAEIGRHVDLDAFEVFDCDTLVKVQLGSGLIALNSVLEVQSAATPDFAPGPVKASALSADSLQDN